MLPSSGKIGTLIGQSDTIPMVRTDCHFGLKVIWQNILHISCMQNILLCGMLRKRRNTYTMLQLIQTRAKDNQIWRQIQNSMPSPIWHTLEPIVNHAVWEMACGMKGLAHDNIANCNSNCKQQYQSSKGDNKSRLLNVEYFFHEFIGIQYTLICIVYYRRNHKQSNSTTTKSFYSLIFCHLSKVICDSTYQKVPVAGKFNIQVHRDKISQNRAPRSVLRFHIFWNLQY